MDERNPGGGGALEGELNRERPLAGPANLPPFDRETPGEAGRPPSHREYPERSGGEGMEGIAMNRGTGFEGGEGLTETAGELGEDIAETATGLRNRARRAVAEGAGEIRDRAEQRTDEALDRAAEGVEHASRRLHQAADRFGEGGRARSTARRWAHQLADSGENTADFLRDTDTAELVEMLENQVRERPWQTLLIAAAAGWVVGKILR